MMDADCCGLTTTVVAWPAVGRTSRLRQWPPALSAETSASAEDDNHQL